MSPLPVNGCRTGDRIGSTGSNPGGQFYTGGIGRFDDGRIAEIFINGAKVGSAAEANAQDAAIVASLALQHGCPVGTIRHALARSGGSTGPLATLLGKVEP